MKNAKPTRYFLYARKSTDEEDKQVLSIETQLTELREFAKKESLIIAKEFIEAKTAKVPGRPVFNAMMAEIEKGKVKGILAWHPDRLARNSVDGGIIVYHLDTEKIASLKFPTFWFENTPQGKFMLNIAFGQSKYYVDNLRENVLRGIRQKLRRGEYPGKAPLGYLNEPKLRTIVPDEATAPLVKKMFEVFASGGYSVPGLLSLATSWGLRTRFNKPITRSYLWILLSNPFYMGLMKVKGELYEGSHPALISKELFEKVQTLLRNRSKPRHKPKAPFAFTGLLKCENCGCAITAQLQKGHHYYYCTRRRGPCPPMRYLREEELAQQLRDILKQVALPEAAREPIYQRIAERKNEADVTFQSKKQDLEQKIKKTTNRLEKLLNFHLDGILEREEYLAQKEKLLHEKLDLQAKLTKLTDQGNSWLEPTQKLVEAGFEASSAMRDENLGKMKDFFQNAGFNLTLAARAARWERKNTHSILADFDRKKPWWAVMDLNQ